MKSMMWRRMVAGLGTAAMLLTNLADVLPSVAYAAEESAIVETAEEAAEADAAEAIVEESAEAAEPEETPAEGADGIVEEPAEDAAAEADAEPADESGETADETPAEEIVLTASAVANGSAIRGYEEIALDFAGNTAIRALAPSIDGYVYTGAALADGTSVTALAAEETDGTVLYGCTTDDGNTIVFAESAVITLHYEKIVNITASVVNTFGGAIDDAHTGIALPDFSDTLALNDPENPPYARIRERAGSIGLVPRYSPEYDFVQATVNGAIISAIEKERIADSDRFVYYYVLADGSREKFTEDSTVYMEYSAPDSVNASYAYADAAVILRAELADPAAVPDEAALTVTQVAPDTAGYSYGAYAEALESSNEALLADHTVFYDIAFLMDAWEIEPESSVKISMEFLQQQLSKGLDAAQGSEIAVTHLAIAPDARKGYITTAAATDLTAADIVAETVDTAAANISGNGNDVLEFSVDSLSVIAVTRVDRSVYNRANGLGAAVVLDATVVDEFGKALDEAYTHIALPAFDEILTLDDPARAPIEKVRTVKRKIGFVTIWSNYSYNNAARLNGQVITAVRKVSLPEGGESYLYTADGENWVPLEEDATIELEYAPADEQRTTYEYNDANVVVTAILEVPDAVPADAELVVTRITEGMNGYDAYMEALNSQAGETEDEAEASYNDANTLLYDIAFMVTDEDGNRVEFQPEDGAVRISMNFRSNQLSAEIAAESAESVEVSHLVLPDEIKDAAESTLDASFSASDVTVEAVHADVTVDGTEGVVFTTEGFSVFVIRANSEKSLQVRNPGSETSEGLLGDAWIYGLTANTWQFNGEAETNFAVKYLTGMGDAALNGGQTGVTNKAGPSAYQYILVGSVNGHTVIKDRPATITIPEAYRDALTHESGSQKLKFIYEDQGTIDAQIDAMLAYVTGQSERLLALDSVDSYQGLPDSNGHIYIDTTGSPAGTYYIDVDQYPALRNRLRENGQVHIKKNSDQKIVFNFSQSTDIRIDKFLVSTDGGEEKDTVTLASTPTTSLNTTETIIFNAPYATSVHLQDAAGIFLMPRATVSFGGVGGGWLVCDEAVSGAEWHFTNGRLPNPDVKSLKATKTVNHDVPTADQVFTFTLKQISGPGASDAVLQTRQNSGSSVDFAQITYRAVGDYIYEIRETATGGMTPDQDVFYAKVTVTGGEDADYSASEPAYYSDRACTIPVGAAAFNNTSKGKLIVQKSLDYTEVDGFAGDAGSDYWKVRGGMKVVVSRIENHAAAETIVLAGWNNTNYTNPFAVTSSTGDAYTASISKVTGDGNNIQIAIEGLPLGTYLVEEYTDGLTFDREEKITVSNKYLIEVAYGGDGTAKEDHTGSEIVLTDSSDKTVVITNKYKKPVDGILAVHKIVVPDYGAEIVRDATDAVLQSVRFRVRSVDDGTSFDFQGGTPGYGAEVVQTPAITYKGKSVKIYYGPWGNATWIIKGLPVGKYTVQEIADGVTIGDVIRYPQMKRVTYYSVSDFANAFYIDNGEGAPKKSSGIRSAAQAADASFVMYGASEDWASQVAEAKPLQNLPRVYEEAAEMVHVSNHYSIPVADFRVTKAMEGREWTDEDSFTFKLEPGEGKALIEGVETAVTSPMPASGSDTVTINKDTVLKVKEYINIDPPESKEVSYPLVAQFDRIIYDHEGEYHYTIREVVPEDADDNIAYDTQVYDITVKVGLVDVPLIKSYNVLFNEIHKSMAATVSCNGNENITTAVFRFTNVYEEKTGATVKKVWQDDENRAGLRPASLTVRLLADGADTGRSVVLSDANDWTDTIRKLPRYNGDKEVVYTWSEEGIPAHYLLTGTGKEGTVTTLTNTLQKGGFQVAKKVESSTDSDRTARDFNFKVTLRESEYGALVSGTFGDRTFTNGVNTFPLKHNGIMTFADIPEGYWYQVEETDADQNGFATTVTGNVGTIAADASPVITFTNKKSEGSLTVAKEIVGGITGDNDRAFPVRVRLNDVTVDNVYEAEGAYTSVEFKGGVADFTLKNGESVTIKGLPDNAAYTVTEELTEADGRIFSSVVTGSTGNISATASRSAKVINTRRTGNLNVSKILVSDAAADKNAAFHFTVTLSEKLNGKYGDMTFANGVAQVSLKGGRSAGATGLPVDVTYTVTEESAAGFEQTARVGDTGTISGTPSEAIFTNTREKGDLEISKELLGKLTTADRDQEFVFTVTLSDSTIGGTYGDMTFAGGTATVKVKGGASRTATGLPTGITYTVTEAKANGFTLTGRTGDTGTISTTKSVAAFTNTRESGELDVTKLVKSSTASDLQKDFRFTVTLYKDQAHSAPAGVAGVFGDMTFADSAASFTLRNGQTARATELPTGIFYEVTEASAEGFTLAGKTGETGEITSQIAVSEFTNKKDEGGLIVSKSVVSERAVDKTKAFSFEVKLSDNTVNGKYGDMDFTDGLASFTLKNGESLSAEGLANGTGYEVTESHEDGFTTTWEGRTGTVVTGKTAAARATNTRDGGNLKLSKVLISDRAADSNRSFVFTIRLDEAITGTYSGVAFADGAAQVSLKGGEEKLIEGLPVGVGYEVTEAQAAGFLAGVVTAGSAKGTISSTLSAVAITNTRETGELTVSKAVLNPLATDDRTTKFNFTITLSDTTISKTYPAAGGVYDEVAFNGGIARVALADGETVTVKGLPTEVGYAVTEQTATGFVENGRIGEGVISTAPSVEAFDNTRNTGDLRVTKTVVSSTQADRTGESFDFTVTLYRDAARKTVESGVNGTFGVGDHAMTFENGVAKFGLKHGETATATGLPTGIYYEAVETNKEGFTLATRTGETGVISAAPAEAKFTNTKNEGGLTVSKSVVSAKPSDKSLSFNFTVTIADGGRISGDYGEMTFDKGVATFSLKDGEHRTATGLPEGAVFTVDETRVDGFTTTWSGGVKGGTIAQGDAPVVVQAVNTRDGGDLRISKALVSDRAADAEQSFAFTIQLPEEISGIFSGVEFTEGKAIITLKGGEEKLIQGLPVGIAYTVTEETTAGFVTGKTGDSGLISGTLSAAEFTNTRETGDLKVSKKVLNPLTDDDTKTAFTFRVTLSDDSINGTYGDMTFADGAATVSIRHGETRVAKDLPTGISYVVTEQAATGFTQTGVTGDRGSIATEPSETVFENTRDTGSLHVTKLVASSTEADKTGERFTFIVTLYKDEARTKVEDSISGTFGEMVFENGVARFDLKHNETKRATDLPTGIYYEAEEAGKDGFTLAGSTGATGEIRTALSAAGFTNQRNEGGLTVTKSVVSDRATDKDQAFTFTVTLDNEKVDGVYGDMRFAAGVATFELKDGEIATATGLPAGTGFAVEEARADGFTSGWAGSVSSGVVANSGEPVVVTAVNTRETGDLTVSKELISDRAADRNQEFAFTIMLGEAITGVYSDVAFQDGVGEVVLKGGERREIKGLPVGITYQVTEADAKGFRRTGVTGDTGTISTEPSTAAFTNTRETGDLKVSKEVLNPLTDDDRNAEFHFTVALEDESINGTYGDMTFRDGVATFTLKDGETKTAKALPTDIAYQATEEQAAGFVEKGTVGKGTISRTASEVKFENTRKTGGLHVTKTVVSSTAADKTDELFDFTVTLYRDAERRTVESSINGTFGDMTFVSGVAAFRLKHDQTARAAGLPTGIYYAVEETERDGFTLTAKTGATGEITAALSEAKLTNTRDEGGLTVSKTVESKLTDDLQKPFRFTVTLDNKTVSGKYGDMEFDQGVAAFTLKDGEQKTATGLASGTGYTVTEEQEDGFTTTWEGETGVIAQEQTKSVRATNRRDEGELTITKKLVSRHEALDKDAAFAFTVILSEKLNGTFGEVVFENGVAGVSLRGGESVKATGLPVGVSYTVTEAPAAGFALAGKTGDTGSISATPAKAEFTNEDTKINATVDKFWASDDMLTVTVRFDLLRKLVSEGEDAWTKVDEQIKVMDVVPGADFHCTFVGLPRYDKDGNEYAYDVVETPTAATKLVNGVVTTVEIKFSASETEVDARNLSDGDKGFGITNTQLIDIPVRKVWEGGEADTDIVVELYKRAPGEADFTTAGDADRKSIRLTLNRANGWAGSFTDLPKYASIEDARAHSPIEYWVKEITNVPGYMTTVSGDAENGLVVTNIREVTRVDVKKVWEDGDNKDGKRPAGIRLNLLKDGAPYNSVEVKAAADGSWSYSWEKLDKYNGEKLIVWSVTEDAVDGYATQIRKQEDGTFLITNSYTPEKTSITATKNWDDRNDADNSRPASIRAQLYRGEGSAKKKVGGAVELKASEDWTYTWTKLDLYENGQKIVYSVEETTVPDGYEFIGVTGDQTGGFFISNRHVPHGSVELIKKDSYTGATLAGARFGLFRMDGAQIGDAQTSGDDGLIRFSDLEYGTYYLEELEAPSGYSMRTDKYYFTIDADRGVADPVRLEAYNDSEQIAIDGAKVWDDQGDADGIRPAGIQVILYANGVEADIQTVTVDANGYWMFDFGRRPKYDGNGREIEYTIGESTVEGYTGMTETLIDADGNISFVITNSHTPATPETPETPTTPGTPGTPTTPTTPEVPPTTVRPGVLGVTRTPPVPTPTVNPSVLGARRAVLGAKRSARVLGARRAATGDEATMVLWGSLSGSSFAGFWVWLLAAMKRRKKERKGSILRRHREK